MSLKVTQKWHQKLPKKWIELGSTKVPDQTGLLQGQTLANQTEAFFNIAKLGLRLWKTGLKAPKHVFVKLRAP